MPKISISEASRISGVARGTLYRDMDSGKLSYEKQSGRRVLDPSELERVYPVDRVRTVRTKPGSANSGMSDSQAGAPSGQGASESPLSELRAKLAECRGQNALLREMVDGFKMRESTMLALLESKLLTDQRPQAKPEKKEKPGKKKKKKKK